MSTHRRILVVDDNNEAAEMVVKLLQLMGHEASAVYDGEAALAVAPLFKPDTILIDLVMPDMDGIQLARRLRQLPGMKADLIALTAFPRQRIADETAAAGFTGILAKPATADQLDWSLRA